MILFTWLQLLNRYGRQHSSRRSLRPARYVDTLEARTMLTAQPVIGLFVDLGAIQIEQYSGDLVTRPIAFNTITEETTVLFNSDRPSPLSFVTVPNPIWLTVSGNGELNGPFDFAETIFINQIGRTDSGEVIGTGNGLLNQSARSVIFDFRTNSIISLGLPSGDLTSSVGLSFDFPVLTTLDSAVLHAVNLNTGVAHRLAQTNFTGTTYVVNGPASLIGGEIDVGSNALVAWDASTGAQTTQFVVPTFVTSTSESVFTGGSFLEFSGIFGSSESHPAVAAISFENSVLDFSTVTGSITHYLGFFTIDGGELLPGQYFATSSANALSTELGSSILTVHEAVVGNPTLSIFNPPPETELTVTLWDGTSFESQTLESILVDQGIDVDLSGYAVVGIDSVPVANGDIRVSVLITKVDPTTGNVVNTILVALTYPGEGVIVDPPSGGGDGGGEAGGSGGADGGNGGEGSGETDGGDTGGETDPGDSGSGGEGSGDTETDPTDSGETGSGGTDGGDTDPDPGSGETDSGNGGGETDSGSGSSDSGSDPGSPTTDSETDQVFVLASRLNLDLDIGFQNLLQNFSFLQQVAEQAPPAYPTQQAEPAPYEPPSTLLDALSAYQEKFRKAVETAKRFLGDMSKLTAAQLRSELNGLADMGILDSSLIDALILEFSDLLSNAPMTSTDVVPAGHTEPAPVKVASGTANSNAGPEDEEDQNPDVDDAGMEEALKELQGAGSK